MKKIKNSIYVFIFVFIILGTVAIAASTYSADSIILENQSILQNAIEDLYSKKTDCPTGYLCFLKHNTPQVGDYVRMTPTVTSFTVDKNKTGYLSYTNVATIYPSKVNLWRVIRINENGTIEIVSADATEEAVTFATVTGYMNYVGYLNVLASKYENSKYTIGSRHMGYSNQTEYITDSSKLTTSQDSTWTCDTGGSCHPENEENLGGGDFGYITDYNLLRNINALAASRDYFIASRYVSYGHWYDCRSIEGGSLSYGYLAYWSSGKLTTAGSTFYLRPILVLKAGINYTPSSGVRADPFILG